MASCLLLTYVPEVGPIACGGVRGLFVAVRDSLHLRLSSFVATFRCSLVWRFVSIDQCFGRSVMSSTSFFSVSPLLPT
jgi:hypothetical protein